MWFSDLIYHSQYKKYTTALWHIFINLVFFSFLCWSTLWSPWPSVGREEQTGPGQLDCKAFLLCPEHTFFLLMVCQELECVLMYGVICRIGSQLSHFCFWQTLFQTDRATRKKTPSTKIKEEPVFALHWCAKHLNCTSTFTTATSQSGDAERL